MFFELYNKADKDNTTRSRLVCDIYKKNNQFVVKFVQFERSDFNKWGKPKVLTDAIITLFYLPEVFIHISTRSKLEGYIKEKFTEDFAMMDKIEEISILKQKIVISLPTSIYPCRKGIPTSNRMVKDTHWPLIVRINERDVSSAFMDFDQYEDKAVETAYQALVNGNMPQSKSDIFYIDGVKSLHDELNNNEL